MASPSASQLGKSLSGGSLSELKRRIFFVIGALIVFRIGTFIPVPGVDLGVMSQIFEQQKTGILGMFNMFLLYQVSLNVVHLSAAKCIGQGRFRRCLEPTKT